ncbi:hypothetical protein JCM10908_006731 [Rhodotorula pacifica]|uniref:autophagy protein ATG9 n=1 Tax=Rhodotorula pacifica TaxID=1495444 RepID=UPI003174CCE8
MALPSRVSAALSDIFLPAHSIYDSLDNPPAEADEDDPISPSSSSPHNNRRISPSRAQGSSALMDDDPFSSVSPSVLSPARPQAAETALTPPPHLESSPFESSQRYTPSESMQDINQRLQYDESTRSDPFQVEPDAVTATSSHSPTPTTSIYLPAAISPDKLPSEQQQQQPISPASSASRGTSRSQGAMSASRSAIGNRSLMGLMGGTRYEGGGFPFGGIGVGEEDEEAEEDGEAGESLRDGENHRAGGQPGRRSSKGRVLLSTWLPWHPGISLTPPRANREHDDLRSLAASLPPPPSALSDTSRTDEDEEDDDAEGPPDFTARIPLVASTSNGESQNLSRSGRTYRPPNLPGSRSQYVEPMPRRSVRLSVGGGGPIGGILGQPDDDDGGSPERRSESSRTRRRRTGIATMSAKERALWRWVNVNDLDGFLHQVYLYYVGKGIWAIGLERTLNLLTVGWVIGFSTFLIGCIDYPRLWDSHHLSEVVIPRCTSRLSGFTLLVFIAFAGFYALRVVRFGMGIRRLWEMHEFYTELLEVPESDIQTIPWHAIVARLSALRATHPSALASRSGTNAGIPVERLDAHDVANRIMREENYLIALFNKDLLDISLPVPRVLQGPLGRLLGKGAARKKRFGKSMLTQTLEWNLGFCLLGFLFGRDGQVRRAFLSERNKKELVEALRRRFILMGLINAVFAPFIVCYLLMYSFFRYFEEYHKNPSSIGSRQFTPLARWKFREFNELPHHFQQRLAQAHPLADQYINHYPKAKTVLLSRFVAFLAGSFAAVLILFSLIDPDAFLHFEITPGRTVLFYIGVFGTILAVARGMLPDENRVVDPELLMREIVEHTHYMPAEWKDKLHSTEVHLAFGKLFQMKVILFLQEIFSVLITPFVLWYTLPRCAGPVVDFFREFTIHVDGLGYVCSFAVFDFKRHGDPNFGAPVQVQEDRWKSSEGKMEKSFMTFAASNPTWAPRDQAQSLFLSKLTEAPAHNSGMHAPPPLGASTRFSTVGSSALPPVRARSRHRAGHGQLHQRFTASPLVEEVDGVGEAPVDAQRRAEKARMYDRAFQQSTLLASSAGSPPHAAVAAGRSQGFQGSHPSNDDLIREESALDGDAFVAPTDTQPFGLPSDEEEGLGEGQQHEGDSLGPGRSLGGLVGELYRR